MWTQAKIKFHTLLFDDSGIAMAYTIVTFLVFFMICISTYAMSENIRRKMELQNACDAAAYSAAVVQADMLSRIAVLNRALSWTYLQTNKRHMDYVAEVWLAAIVNQHTNDKYNTRLKHITNTCHPKPLWYGYYASWITDTLNNREEVLLEGVNRGLIDNEFVVPNNRIGLEAQIAQGNRNMLGMELAIAGLMGQMESNICAAAMLGFISRRELTTFQIWQGNRCYDSRNLPSGAVPPYFVRTSNENTFLAYTGANSSSMGRGHNSWWCNIANGIQRNYVTGGLRAQYNCMSFRYVHPYSSCVLAGWFSGTRFIEPCSINTLPDFPTIGTIPGNQGLLSSYQVTGSYRLAQSFFGKAGTILVTATTPMSNPFSVIAGIDVDSGIYSTFGSFASENMWAASAARAGIRLRGDAAGFYRVQWPGEQTANAQNYNSVGIWNLCEDDWDGVLLPVIRAWDDTEQERWGADTKPNPTGAAVNIFSDLMRNVQNKLSGIREFTDPELENMYRNNMMRH